MPAQARGSISYRASRRTLQKVPSLSQSYRASSPKNQIQDNAHSDAMRPALLASQVVARLKSKLKSKGDDFDVANQASELDPSSANDGNPEILADTHSDHRSGSPPALTNAKERHITEPSASHNANHQQMKRSHSKLKNASSHKIALHEDGNLFIDLHGGVFGPGAAIQSAEELVHEEGMSAGEIIKKEGVLCKQVVGAEIRWSERYVTLTSHAIYFRNNREGTVREEIDLLDVTHVTKCSNIPGDDVHALHNAALLKEAIDRDNADKYARHLVRRSSTMSPNQSNSFSKRLPSQERQLASDPKTPKSGILEDNKRSLGVLQWENAFEVYVETIGRTYYMRAPDTCGCDEWIRAINEAIKNARVEEEIQLRSSLSISEQTRLAVKHCYDHPHTQMCIAILLLGNFVISIYQSEIHRRMEEELEHRFDVIEMVFTFIYTMELTFNMIGHWFWPFFLSPWNWFDLIIVGLSIFDAMYVLGGGSGSGLNTLRLLRILRVVRIFNKLENMRRILRAISAAFAPVTNAFLLFVVLLSIYAVMGVNLLSSMHSVDERGERFSKFSEAFCALLGIATGDEWVTFILEQYRAPDGSVDWTVAVYFISFNVLVFILSFNIIVAVLIEGFMSSMLEDLASKRILAETRECHRNAGSLDPLLATLANFTSPQHLRSQIDLLFDMWDVDGGGVIDFQEIKTGLTKLGYVPNIYMSDEDWGTFSQHGLFCDEYDHMDRARFQLAMRFQIDEYSQRLLANKMVQSVREENEFAPILFALKMACHEIMETAQERRKAAVQLAEAPAQRRDKARGRSRTRRADTKGSAAVSGSLADDSAKVTAPPEEERVITIMPPPQTYKARKAVTPDPEHIAGSSAPAYGAASQLGKSGDRDPEAATKAAILIQRHERGRQARKATQALPRAQVGRKGKLRQLGESESATQAPTPLQNLMSQVEAVKAEIKEQRIVFGQELAALRCSMMEANTHAIASHQEIRQLLRSLLSSAPGNSGALSACKAHKEAALSPRAERAPWTTFPVAAAPTQSEQSDGMQEMTPAPANGLPLTLFSSRRVSSADKLQPAPSQPAIAPPAPALNKGLTLVHQVEELGRQRERERHERLQEREQEQVEREMMLAQMNELKTAIESVRRSGIDTMYDAVMRYRARSEALEMSVTGLGRETPGSAQQQGRAPQPALSPFLLPPQI